LDDPAEMYNRELFTELTGIVNIFIPKNISIRNSHILQVKIESVQPIRLKFSASLTEAVT